MHILYVDESGDDGFPAVFPDTGTPTRVFIRTGLIIHDRRWRRINTAIDEFKYRFGIPKSIELHATEIAKGRKRITDIKTGKRRSVPNWYGSTFPKSVDRWNILKECCRLLNTLDLTLICIVIDKTKIKRTDENYRNIPKDISWEYLIERYNLFLRNAKDHVGIIISDAIQVNIEKQYRQFAKDLYSQSLHVAEYHFIESILFEPSDSSNLIQIVDIASYAFFRNFNSGDTTLYDELSSKLMQRNGTVQGVGSKIWP